MEKYSQNSLLQAMERVREGSMSIRQASREYGVPYGTLGDKLRGRRPVETKSKFVLSPNEENHLSQWILEMGRRGFGLTRDEIKDTVKRILDSRGAISKFKDNRPGKFWMASFFKRHPELAMRTPQALGKERALVSREGLDRWFRDFKAYVLEQDPDLLSSPDRIWNADESGFSLSTKAKKVVMERGKKHPYKLTGKSKSQVTVLACHSASGRYLPPLIIYPYKRQPSENLLEGFPEAHFQLSGNGWITAPIFHTWLRDMFIPCMEGRRRPVLLLVDGHSSHSALIETLTLCAENGIILYCFKAHSSHLTQPLDQAFFGAIKSAWEKSSRGFLFDSGENVGLRTFASVFKKAWDSTATIDIALKGFSASGIYPFNPNKVLSSDKLAPSLLFSGGNVELESASLSSPASNNQSTSALSKQMSSLRDLTDKMFVIGKERCKEFIDCYEAGKNNAHGDYDVFSNLLNGLLTPVCPPSDPLSSSDSDDGPPVTTRPMPQPVVSNASISSQPGCSSSYYIPQGPPPSNSNPPSTNGSVSSVSVKKPRFVMPQRTLTLCQNVLTFPQFKKSKTQQKQKAFMPMALSGNAYLELLQRKKDEKEEAIRIKQQKKKEREETKKRKAEEKEILKRKRKEAKEIRKKKKRKRDEEEALIEFLRELEKKSTVEEESDSESGGDGDVQSDDESEVD